MTEQKFVAEKAKIGQELVRIPGVVGLGWGFKSAQNRRTDAQSVRVYVRHKHAAGDLSVDHIVPKHVVLDNGEILPTDVVQVGNIQLYAFTGRYRPAQPGAVLSHYAAEYAGTFGALVTDNTDGKKVILSASHALANFNNATIGDNILQPGPQYGGVNPGDAIATLKRFIPLNLDPFGENFVDAAIAKLNSNNIANGTPFSSQVKPTKQGAIGLLYAGSDQLTVINPIQAVISALNITLPKIASATVGMSIHKCGAATGYTMTNVSDIHVDLLLTAPNGNEIWFRDQITTAGGVSDAQAGDSGAVWYTTFNV